MVGMLDSNAVTICAAGNMCPINTLVVSADITSAVTFPAALLDAVTPFHCSNSLSLTAVEFTPVHISLQQQNEVALR